MGCYFIFSALSYIFPGDERGSFDELFYNCTPWTDIKPSLVLNWIFTALSPTSPDGFSHMYPDSLLFVYNQYMHQLLCHSGFGVECEGKKQNKTINKLQNWSRKIKLLETGVKINGSSRLLEK